jgi:hypothetical protein
VVCLFSAATTIQNVVTSNGTSAIVGNYAPPGSTGASNCVNSKSTCSNVPTGAQMKFKTKTDFLTCAAGIPCKDCQVEYVLTIYGVYDAAATLTAFKAAFTPALTDEAITVKTANVAFVTGLPQAIKVTFTVQHTKTWTALSLTGISGVVDVAAPAITTLAAAVSAADKASAPKVEITLGFAAALTTAEQVCLDFLARPLSCASRACVDHDDARCRRIRSKRALPRRPKQWLQTWRSSSRPAVRWNTLPPSMPRMRPLLQPSRPSWLTRK